MITHLQHTLLLTAGGGKVQVVEGGSAPITYLDAVIQHLFFQYKVLNNIIRSPDIKTRQHQYFKSQKCVQTNNYIIRLNVVVVFAPTVFTQHMAH